MDTELFIYCKNNKINSVQMTIKESYGEQITTSLSQLWKFRIDVIDYLIQNNISVIHSDADAIWLNDFQQYLFETKIPIIFSQGTVFPYDVFDSWGFVLCCGLFYFESNEKTKLVIKEINTLIHDMTDADDQITVNHYFHNKLKVKWNIDSYEMKELPIQFGNELKKIKYSSEFIIGVFEHTSPINDITGLEALFSSGLLPSGEVSLSFNQQCFIGLLPLDKFQRLEMDTKAKLKHILSSKTGESKMEMFKRTGCLF